MASVQQDSAEASAIPSVTPTLFEGEFNVSLAENEFSAFALVLHEESRRERTASLKSGLDFKDGKDIEAAEEEPFDLREYLTSSNDKNQAAGIKHKKVTVVWEDLQVDVFGGINHKVRRIGCRRGHWQSRGRVDPPLLPATTTMLTRPPAVHQDVRKCVSMRYR